MAAGTPTTYRGLDAKIQMGSKTHSTLGLSDFTITLDRGTVEQELVGEPGNYFLAGSMSVEGSFTAAKLDNTALSEEYEEQVLQDPEIFTETAPLVVQMQEENLEGSLDSTKQFVDSVADPMLDPEVKEAVTNQVKLWEMLQSVTEEFGPLDYAADLGKAFLPFRDTFNEAMLIGGVLGNEEKMSNLVLEFKSLPFKEQQALFQLEKERFFQNLKVILKGLKRMN